MSEHPDVETLEAYVANELTATSKSALESHTEFCTRCRTIVEALRTFEERISASDTWKIVDSITAPHRHQLELEDLAAQIASEDQRAIELLGGLIAKPAAFLWSNLPARSRFRTGGVVRLLSRTANEVCEIDPQHARNLADTAIQISELLPDDLYPAHGVYELRGSAWKARANALLVLGDFANALHALTRAERDYARLPFPGLGLASV